APRGFFRKGEVSGWKAEMSGSEVRALEHLAGELMRALGYETVTPRGAPAPRGVRWRLWKRALRERVQRWAWESKSPLRTLAASALKRVPFVRRALLRRMARPEGRRAA